MAVKYKLFRDNRDGSKTQGQYFARATMTGVVRLPQIAERIQRNCSVKRSDVNAVLIELIEVLHDELLASHRVFIDGLGSFKVGLKTKPAESPEKFNASRNIVGTRINFLPSVSTTGGVGRVKDLLYGVNFEEYGSYDNFRAKKTTPVAPVEP